MRDFKRVDAPLEVTRHAFVLRGNLLFDVIHQLAQARLRFGAALLKTREFFAQSCQQVLELFATHDACAPEMIRKRV